MLGIIIIEQLLEGAASGETPGVTKPTMLCSKNSCDTVSILLGCCTKKGNDRAHVGSDYLRLYVATLG